MSAGIEQPLFDVAFVSNATAEFATATLAASLPSLAVSLSGLNGVGELMSDIPALSETCVEMARIVSSVSFSVQMEAVASVSNAAVESTTAVFGVSLPPLAVSLSGLDGVRELMSVVPAVSETYAEMVAFGARPTGFPVLHLDNEAMELPEVGFVGLSEPFGELGYGLHESIDAAPVDLNRGATADVLTDGQSGWDQISLDYVGRVLRTTILSVTGFACVALTWVIAGKSELEPDPVEMLGLVLSVFIALFFRRG